MHETGKQAVILMHTYLDFLKYFWEYLCIAANILGRFKVFTYLTDCVRVLTSGIQTKAILG